MHDSEKHIVSCKFCIHKKTCVAKRGLDNTIEDFQTLDYIKFTKFDLHQMLAQCCSEYQSLSGISKNEDFQKELNSDKKEKDTEDKEPKLENEGIEENQLERLRQLYKEKKYDIVIDKLNNILDEQPKNIQILISLANCHKITEDYINLNITSDKILEINGKNHAGLFFKGFSNYMLENYEIAINFFERCLEINPDDSEVEYSYAISLLNLDKPTKAKQMFIKLLEKNPENEDVLYYTGMSAYNEKSYENALTYFDKVLTKNPNHVKSLFKRGQIFLNTNKINEEIFSFEKILNLYPDEIIVLNHLGECYRQKNNFNYSESLFEKVLKMDSENVTALSNIAFIYFFDKERNDKNVEWAIQYAERALLVDPNDVISLVVKANSFFETNLDGNAELCLKKALASEQTEHYAYQYALYALAQIYADNDNIDEAMNSLRSLFNITDIFKEDINKNKRFKKLKNIEEFKKFVD